MILGTFGPPRTYTANFARAIVSLIRPMQETPTPFDLPVPWLLVTLPFPRYQPLHMTDSCLQVDEKTPLPDLLENMEWSTFQDAELENTIQYVRGCVHLQIPEKFRKCIPQHLLFGCSNSNQPIPLFE